MVVQSLSVSGSSDDLRVDGQAALKNTVLALMDWFSVGNVADQQRLFATQFSKAFALLLVSDF